MRESGGPPERGPTANYWATTLWTLESSGNAGHAKAGGKNLAPRDWQPILMAIGWAAISSSWVGISHLGPPARSPSRNRASTPTGRPYAVSRGNPAPGDPS